MALDITTALEGGTWAIIQAECCVFIPAESANVASFFFFFKHIISSPLFLIN